jgi:hypothetical protein
VFRSARREGIARKEKAIHLREEERAFERKK